MLSSKCFGNAAYDLITVDPRNKFPSLNTLSENYRRNTVFGVVEERIMLKGVPH